MKLKYRLNTMLAALGLVTGLVNAAPLNEECGTNAGVGAHNKDCPNDPETLSWEYDYMNMSYAWDKSYGTSRVAIIDRLVDHSMIIGSEFGKVRTHDSGSYYCRLGDDLNLNLEPFSIGSQCSGSKIFKELEISEFGRTIGTPNSGQNSIINQPIVFVNEHALYDNKPDRFIEVAVKSYVNPSHISLKFTNQTDSKTFSLEDDFQRGAMIDGYTLYSMRNFDVIDSQGVSYLKLLFDNTPISQPDAAVSSTNCNLSNTAILDYKNGLSSCRYSNEIKYFEKFIPSFPESTTQSYINPFIESKHGDLIMSLLGAKSNNNMGAPSFCRECSLSFAMTYDDLSGVYTGNDSSDAEIVEESIQMRSLAFSNAIDQGNQIINLSGYFGPISYYNCHQQGSRGIRQGFCTAMERAKDRDVVFVASGGNSRGGIFNWPANEQELVIGVGGTDYHGRIWDDLQNSGSCPPEGEGGMEECGSQYGGNDPIMAPANDILVYHECGEYTQKCDGDPNMQYQLLSGTSFAAPIISGLVSIMRSLNPLSSFDEIKDNLKTSRVFTDSQNRSYAIPNIAQIIKHKILGFSNGQKLANRVKPMFRLRGEFYESPSMKNTYLSTSIPQVAVAALSKSYLASIDEETGLVGDTIRYYVDNQEPLALGYTSFRGSNVANNARAPFYVFGGHENPFTGEDDMLPLHHFAYKEAEGYTSYPGCANKADHGYSTNLTNKFVTDSLMKCQYTHNAFKYEGIEGYLLPECPVPGACYGTSVNSEEKEESNINWDVNAPQCLRIRYSEADDSHAIFMESEQNSTKFASYTTPINHYNGMSNSECLGYVFPNVDSDNDLVIDGMEMVLGTDPLDSDSDDDGVLDGEEYPPASNYISDPLISNL